MQLPPTRHRAQINYRYRTGSFAFALLVLLAVMAERGYNAGNLALGILTLVAYPQLAYLYARFAADSERAEFRNLGMDAVLCGIWSAQLDFALWPTVGLLLGICMNNAICGGARILFSGVAIFIAAAAAWALAWGASYQPATGFIVTFLCLLGVVGYGAWLGLGFHARSLRLHRTRDVLRASEERFRILAEQLPHGLMLLDPSGRFEYLNPAFVAMTGYRQSEVPDGRTWFARAYPDEAYRHEVIRIWKEDMARVGEGQSRPREFVIACRDGSAKTVLFRPVLMSDGRQLVLLEDVTEQRHIEAVRLNSQRLESLGTLAGGIAHDFNNILAAIRGNADLAATDVGPHHAAMESLEEIRKASVRAGELVRRIMAFGRPKEPHREKVNLNLIVEEVLKLLRPTLPAEIELRTRFATENAELMADAAQLHEVVMNLTTNAVQAIGRRVGRIEYAVEALTVGTEQAARIGLPVGRYAKLTVADDGSGMEEATRVRIFDVFFTTKPVGVGTGLGLSMVYGIVRSHGGAINVESAPGRGSCFELYLPAAEAALGTKTDDKQVASGMPPPAPGKRLLYVDDEVALVLLANKVLSRRGHQVFAYTNPSEALAAFRARPGDFDAVVTDLSMPQMSGFDLARELHAVRPDVPVILTSGYLHGEDEQRARDAGIQRVVLKPATMDELAQILDGVLRGEAAALRRTTSAQAVLDGYTTREKTLADTRSGKSFR